VALLAIPVAPLVLRQVDFFRVRRVELLGVRYLAPETLLDALRLSPDRNLFDDNGPVADRAAAIPGVVNVRVVRRLPATLRVEITERVPVAFAPTEAGLVAFDAEARSLPYDPTASGLDLPLVPRPDTVLIRVLGVVRAADSLLFREVDAARRGRGDMVILELEQRQVLLQAIPQTADVRAVEAVRRHLVANGRPFDQLDARFAGWIIVRRGRV
jgi:cell division septal protein FtsQ